MHPKIKAYRLYYNPVHNFDEKFLNENNYNTIIQMINMIPLPSEYWIVTVLPMTIIFNEWTEDLKETRVCLKLENNMSFTVSILWNYYIQYC